MENDKQKALEAFNAWLKYNQKKMDVARADNATFDLFLQAETIRTALAEAPEGREAVDLATMREWFRANWNTEIPVMVSQVSGVVDYVLEKITTHYTLSRKEDNHD